MTGYCPAIADRRVGPPITSEWLRLDTARCSKMVSVAEDWAPCWYGLVRVSLRSALVERTGETRWYVSVWGADDEGMTRWLPTEAQAHRLFDRIQHLVTKADLRSWGFRWA